MILCKWPTWRTNSFLCINFFFITLHVLSTSCLSSGERNFINTTSGNCHSVLVALCAGWEFTPNLHMTQPPTQSDSYQRLYCIQFFSPDDEHEVLETCTELWIKNKYIERNLCVTLVIYQESLHDAWSTKCKILSSTGGTWGNISLKAGFYTALKYVNPFFHALTSTFHITRT